MGIFDKYRSELRARAEVLRILAVAYPDEKRFFQSGFVPDKFKYAYTNELERIMLHAGGTLSQEEKDNPLSFTELASNDAFFYVHPHKIAGTQETTTSLAFPITVKGTIKDVFEMFSFLGKKNPEDNYQSELKILELEAEAELLLLELIEI